MISGGEIQMVDDTGMGHQISPQASSAAHREREEACARVPYLLNLEKWAKTIIVLAFTAPLALLGVNTITNGNIKPDARFARHPIVLLILIIDTISYHAVIIGILFLEIFPNIARASTLVALISITLLFTVLLWAMLPAFSWVPWILFGVTLFAIFAVLSPNLNFGTAESSRSVLDQSNRIGIGDHDGPPIGPEPADCQIQVGMDQSEAGHQSALSLVVDHQSGPDQLNPNQSGLGSDGSDSHFSNHQPEG